LCLNPRFKFELEYFLCNPSKDNKRAKKSFKPYKGKEMLSDGLVVNNDRPDVSGVSLGLA